MKSHVFRRFPPVQSPSVLAPFPCLRSSVCLRLVCLLAGLWPLSVAVPANAAEPDNTTEKGPRKRVAAIVTEYRHNSHADMFVSRLLQGYYLDGTGGFPRMELVSLYTDQVPHNDISRDLARRHGFRITESVADALTLGTGKLAVDGVLLIAEHGDYPKSPSGQTIFPKKRLFEQIARVFRASGRSVPVFCDKHLSDNQANARRLFDTSRELKIPLMAGSTIPLLWRFPPADVPRGAKLQEIVGVSYHTLDAYGFHGMEMLQCLAEQRAGGETGIASVQCLTGDAVWRAAEAGLFSSDLLLAALGRLKERPLPAGFTLETVQQKVREPVLFQLQYRDGLKTSLITLNGAVVEWAAAWRTAGKKSATGSGKPAIGSTVFWTQELRPFTHFALLTREIDRMMHTGRAPWPVERTLLTSSALDALLQSKLQGGRKLDTPGLNITYQPGPRWKQPPPPPPGRPITGP